MIARRHHMIFIKILSSGNTQQTHNHANNKHIDDLKTTTSKHTESVIPRKDTHTHIHRHTVSIKPTTVQQTHV